MSGATPTFFTAEGDIVDEIRDEATAMNVARATEQQRGDTSAEEGDRGGRGAEPTGGGVAGGEEIEADAAEAAAAAMAALSTSSMA